MKDNFITECHWEITKNCNLSCIHCISSAGIKKELNTKSALKVIEKLDDLGCKELYITGGEPLVRKDIFEILNRAKEKKFKIGLLTNGTLINNGNIKEIKSYTDEIGISLDGSTTQVNDRIRGAGSFVKIIKAISIIKRAQIPLTLYITLTNINLKDFKNILRLVKKLRIDNLRVNEVTLRGKAYKNRKQLKINNRKHVNLERRILKTLGLKKTDIVKKDNCDVKPTTIFLSSTGYIYPCIEVFQRKPALHFTSILEPNFENIIEHLNLLSKFKKKRCPYRFIIGTSSTVCLNRPSVNCHLV